MRYAIVLLAVLLGALALAAPEKPAERVIYVQFSVKERTKMQDWGGSATISAGRIVRVEKDSGPMDSVNPDGSWSIIYGRGLGDGGTKLPPTTRKGIILAVEAPDDAVVTLRTKGGEFSFRVGEVTGAGIERLDGNARVSLGRPAGGAGAQVAKRAGGEGGKRAGGGGGDQHLGGSGAAGLGAAVVAGEIPAERYSDAGQQSDWPAVAVASDGAVWVAWIEWNGKDADRVLVRRRPAGGEWGAPIPLGDGSGDHYFPAIAARGTGVAVVWTGQKEGNPDLYAAEVTAAGQPSPVRRLTEAPFGDFNARMASDRAGNVTLVWQSFRDGQADIYARRLDASGWGPEVRLSPSDANDWEPAVAVDSRGAAWVSWDSYEFGNYDVFLRSLEAGRPGRLIPVTTETDAQFHSSVAVDGQNRVWVAWDEGGQNWGKDFCSSSAAPGSRGMHASRALAMRVWDGTGLRTPEAPLAPILTGRMQRYAELPHLAVDGAGTLWMVFRHWTGNSPTEVYHFYATRLEGGKWAVPWRLGSSSGLNTQRAGLALGADGRLLVTYSSDGRGPGVEPQTQMHAWHYQTYLATLEKGPGPAGMTLADVKLPPAEKAPPRRARATMQAGGKSYTLLYGDCHRHTDIRGHGGVDGSLLDTYRYGRDAAQLDFLGVTDHNEATGGRWADGLRDYSWWWTQKAVDLFHCPPAFIAVYSYEHSMSSPGGHRNILFLKRGAPLRPIDRERAKEDNLPTNMWAWVRANVLGDPAQKCVIVPHTFAAGPLATWDWPNPEFDGLLEIYQGCRGSYEAWNLPKGEKRGGTQTPKQGHFAQDALARGNKYGFVSFSDHGSTHCSWAGIWAEKADRGALLDAMLARRTFAATDEIVLDVTADGHAPGEEFRAKTAPAIRMRVTAPDTLLRIDVVKDGKYVWTGKPTGRTFEATYRDADIKPGACTYYVRVFQRDPYKPEGDPNVGWSSPWFVTYE